MTLTPATESVADGELPHGFTITQLSRMSREAAFASRWQFLGIEERTDVAQFAILEYLYTTDEPGDFWTVVTVGSKAIYRHAVKDLHHRGVARQDNGPLKPITRYWLFWRSASLPTRSPEDPVVEALATTQILARLSPAYQRVLLALAEHDDYHQAAAALGKAYHGFESTLSMARKQFLRLWHEGEAPSHVWGRDRRSTHSRRDRTADHKKITVTTIRRRRQRHARKANADGR